MNLQGVDPSQRWLLAGLGAAIGCVLWVQLLWVPQSTRARQRADEWRKLQREVEEIRRQAAQLPQLEAARRKLTADLAGVAAGQGAAEGQLPGLLERITQAARQSRVRIATLKPRVHLDQLKRDASGALEVPLELVGAAGYHQLGAFLDALERSPDLIRVRELELRPGASDIWTHQVSMTLLLYLASGPPRTQSS